MRFWAALHEVYGKTRVQRCWVHKTANVLNAMPKAVQSNPAEHWKHFRTTNPIESTFATVRHRTTKGKGCLSRKTALTMPSS